MKLQTQRPDIIDAHLGELYVTDGAAIDAEKMLEDGAFSGIAMFYNRKNSNDRTYMHGCFDKSIRTNQKIMQLWDHNSAWVTGRWDEFSTSGNKLFADGKLTLGSTHGRDAYELIKDKAINGLSVGWVPYFEKSGSVIGLEFDDETGHCKVHEAELIETSIVAFPAASKARIRKLNASGLRDAGTVRELEKYFRGHMDMTRSDAKILISHCMDVCEKQQQAGGLQDGKIIKQTNKKTNPKSSSLVAIDSAMAEIFGSKDGDKKQCHNFPKSTLNR